MHEGPARQNRTGNFSFAAGGMRDGASEAPRNDNTRKQCLGLFGLPEYLEAAAHRKTTTQFWRPGMLVEVMVTAALR